EDLVLEEEDLNLEEDRHEESLPVRETRERDKPRAGGDSILAGLVAGIQSPGDAVSGHGTRNASSSVPTHTPSFNQ
ncbi:hypothetical protein Dimus_035857, partial [Dionaea muscipula]